MQRDPWLACDDVEHAGGQAHFCGDVAQLQGGQGGQLRGLDHHAVAGGQGGRHLPSHHKHCTRGACPARQDLSQRATRAARWFAMQAGLSKHATAPRKVTKQRRPG